MRFRHRSSVDFPHPDGPMIAVTFRSRNSSDTPCTTRVAPKYASRFDTVRRAPRTASAAAAILAAASETTVRGTRGPRRPPDSMTGSVARSNKPPPRREPRDDADDENEPDENQRPGPRLGDPGVVGSARIDVDLMRERGDRLVECE